MGITVYSLEWVMQDFVHQQYGTVEDSSFVHQHWIASWAVLRLRLKLRIEVLCNLTVGLDFRLTIYTCIYIYTHIFVV